MSYTDSLPLPPRTLTEFEQARLLKATAEHARGYRDHLIVSAALGTALREAELLALNMGDVFDASGRSHRRVQLRVYKKSNDDPASQQVFLPDALRGKLDRFYRWKVRRGQSVAAEAPLFVSRNNNRLSARQLRHAFRTWQIRAGFERLFPFHALRHSALTNTYRATRDIRLTQRVARHKSISSTIRYAGPSDEDVLRATRHLPC